MRKAALTGVLLLVSIPVLPQGSGVGTKTTQQSLETTAYGTEEAYRVYDALIPHQQAYRLAEDTVFVQQETLGRLAYPVRECFTEEAWSRFREAIKDLTHVNSKRWLLKPILEIHKPYEVVPEGSIALRSGLDRNKQGSGPFIALSAVGFNRKKRMAVVYAINACGGLCGSAAWHLLEKVDGKWKEVPGARCAVAS